MKAINGMLLALPLTRQVAAITLLVLMAMFMTFNVNAASDSTSMQSTTVKAVSQTQHGSDSLALNCEDEGGFVCNLVISLCDDYPNFCQSLLERLCEKYPELCDGIPLPPECTEDDEECQQPPACEENDEECQEPPECEENDEECHEPPECEENDEECQEPPVCEDDEEECQQPPVCEDDENCEASTGYNNPNPVSDNTVKAVERDAANRASRFLSQATLGADYPTITQVAAMGEAEWLESQFEQPVGFMFPYTDYLVQHPLNTGENDVFGSPINYHMHAWWTQAMTSPDLVRQRVAMALSEIFVVSSNVEIIGESPYAVTSHYDILLANSFGNFRDLLRDITLSPVMAIYLSHLNNQKANPETGTFPDENYAREIMQLFSIGLFELNPDGTRKKDAQGNDIPTYGQPQIREFAKIFTGLSMAIEDEGFGATPCCNDDFYEFARDRIPLTMFDAFHATGEKRLLNGVVVPAGQTGMQDIESAMDNLFNHPNVGPFIGHKLIQRLVKSNPSPAYIARVTAAFNGDNGTPRGDMKAVIRAILLDPEAREMTSAHDGRLREPFLRLLRLARSFKATTPDRNFAGDSYDVLGQIQQYVFYAPSVFNFFQPDYSPNGEIKDAGLVAPEFQITNASTIIEIKNIVQLWVETGRFDEGVGELPFETVSFEHQLALADNPDALLDHLDTVMTYGTLTDNTRAAIRTVIMNEADMMMRVKKAVYLMAISPDYAAAI